MSKFKENVDIQWNEMQNLAIELEDVDESDQEEKDEIMYELIDKIKMQKPGELKVPKERPVSKRHSKKLSS